MKDYKIKIGKMEKKEILFGLNRHYLETYTIFISDEAVDRAIGRILNFEQFKNKDFYCIDATVL